MERFLKWSVLGTRTRTISPFSDLTVADWVKSTIKDGTLDNLRAAMLVDPANARLVAYFGMALGNCCRRKNKSRRCPTSAGRS
jgi:hypothetical protein